MAKIKHTKNELKAQRESLGRYERFLPMLLLKKQQLQMEMQGIDARRDICRAESQELRSHVESWVRLFAEPVDFSALTRPVGFGRSYNNIAGVTIPVFESGRFERGPLDLFATPPWIDRGLLVVENLMSLNAELEVLDEQHRLIAAELRITTQRVNLFEKVKIPECRENIRVIKIFLGDRQTAGVARAKNAKSRLENAAAGDEAVPMIS